MQSLTVVLLLAVVASCYSHLLPRQKTFFARAIATFTCKNALIKVPIEFMKAGKDKNSHESLEKVTVRFGTFDAVVHDGGRKQLLQKIFFQDKKPDLFLRVTYDCGCGKVYDTNFIPSNYVKQSEAEASAKPFNYGVVDLSKCK
uniref:DUF3718 domain-containing protein n=1 Tax=Panagrellus redivivus TaxID=6233 RepID=A0A7E4VLE3_PANRE